ncbi:uncharacterized protein LOC111705500 [Eurytemora carolleeae]|uniref:uncharacterized protein LOC111705500 n=1 Tax=Eurytemora carolleeae TaxID=1294199 RepID=UPI000C757154|nr:uncharacterized protein LOC111705500 [Eurytemora carolleeae]|eukprot:XP_023333842.1 uncharacterized protein LOC111705500 [Eurytemora affinis]
MGLIEDELDEVRRCCETQVPYTKVVTTVPAMVRIEVEKTSFKKIIVCFLFPSEYPSQPILIELKSKTLKDKLLTGLTKICEDEAKKNIGKPQIILVLKLISKFLEENPLSACADEISTLKSLLGPEDSIRLSQKSSTVSLKLQKNRYTLQAKLTIPENYPIERVDIGATDCNFPRVFKVWFVENAKELARRCVEPPLKPKPNQPRFEAKTSLLPAAKFLIESVQRYPCEPCQICRQVLFPADPEAAIHNEKAAAHVERVYCGHAYHHDCLILYMKTPPFQNGKKCPGCGNRIYHEKWKVTPELAEARWASEQAKARELGDVVEFIKDCTL